MDQDLVELHARMLRAWQLAILRFAITLDHTDRLGALAIASEMDRLGQKEHKEEFAFGFFRRTSAELCASVLQRDETADEILMQHIARIDDARMKRAFAAAVAIEQPQSPAVRRRSKPEIDLWKGLRPRGGVHG
ncbi:hypothetical protein LQG66_31935 [Bradyrhizobium ontarionense]|uniref:Uncharacterized protein n=1 Tax=Bradyrhizobium ontarionense TaxID=2898149 RepID=A0ABY3R8X3_9BRAD|nr:hypothetical protein [Bradyrhizobium sp. A19]UFZ03766.1 hypothetical protein LQG66_31935 [Bradyrhizobium sp. A19]